MTSPPSFGTFPEIHPFWYRHPSLTIDLIIACIARIPFNSITKNKMIGTILNSHALIGNWDCVVFQHFFAVIFFFKSSSSSSWRSLLVTSSTFLQETYFADNRLVSICRGHILPLWDVLKRPLSLQHLHHFLRLTS